MEEDGRGVIFTSLGVCLGFKQDDEEEDDIAPDSLVVGKGE